MRLRSVSVTVSGTMLRPSRVSAFSKRGWRALRSDRLPSSEMTGIPAIMSRAVCAFAIRKSISPMNAAPASRSGRYGRRNSVNSKRIFWISRPSSKRSSAMSFSSSMISAGSTKAVLPEAETSCTKPWILRLAEVPTGMRNLPSRTVTSASASTMPSSCALRRMAPARLEIAASLLRRSRRISKRRSEAESLTSPYLSRMPSMRRWTSGKLRTGAASRSRRG